MKENIDHTAFDTSDIVNIQMYLMKKQDKKYSLG